MTCDVIEGPDGRRMIVCSPRRPIALCKCRERATRLCDFVLTGRGLGGGRTCDMKLCDRCTFSPAPGVDLCAKHRAAPTQATFGWEAA